MNCRAMLCPYIRLHHCLAGQTRIPYVAGSYQWNIVSFEEEERWGYVLPHYSPVKRFAAVSAQNVKNVQFDYTNMPTYNTITK